MDGAVNPATASQRGICGVDNCVDFRRVISPIVRAAEEANARAF